MKLQFILKPIYNGIPDIYINCNLTEFIKILREDAFLTEVFTLGLDWHCKIHNCYEYHRIFILAEIKLKWLKSNVIYCFYPQIEMWVYNKESLEQGRIYILFHFCFNYVGTIIYTRILIS